MKSISLNTILRAAFALIFAGILAIGAASLYLVQRMMDWTFAIEGQSRDVVFIHELHAKTYDLIVATQRLVPQGDGDANRQVGQIADDLDRDIKGYLEQEAESPYPEGEAEIDLLARLRAQLRALRRDTAAAQGLLAASPQNAAALTDLDASLDRHADAIAGLVLGINRLHFDVIDRKVAKADQGRAAISRLHLICTLVGLLLLSIGYLLHSRFVVRPVVRLADATVRVASGDLDVRLDTNSRTEIGGLCMAFNQMVARLRAHEDFMVEFSRHLEERVASRTADLQQANAELHATQAELVRFEKMAMLGQIAASVNHEVRTPLNTLSMNVQLIRKGFAGCSNDVTDDCRLRRQNILDRILLVDREIQRISDMLEEFVRYARLAPPQTRELALNPLVHHVADLILERAQQASVNVELSLAEPCPAVRADEDKLLQALINLCINAIHAMPHGGSLGLSTALRGESAEIRVSDTGTGIAEQDLDRIFQPFFTSKKIGLGFGLSIVRRIVEDHDGEIVCQTRMGEGTVFTVRLPLWPQAAEQSQE